MKLAADIVGHLFWLFCLLALVVLCIGTGRDD
jgi:hypothetical protein